MLAGESAPTRRLLQATIERCGHEVVAVGDGQAAVDACARVVPEIGIAPEKQERIFEAFSRRRSRSAPASARMETRRFRASR